MAKKHSATITCVLTARISEAETCKVQAFYFVMLQESYNHRLIWKLIFSNESKQISIRKMKTWLNFQIIKNIKNLFRWLSTVLWRLLKIFENLKPFEEIRFKCRQFGKGSHALNETSRNMKTDELKVWSLSRKSQTSYKNYNFNCISKLKFDDI